MKAVVMSTPGGPEVLRLQELPEPAITHGRQLRVRLKAAGINPIDTKLRRRGTFFPERMPAVLGCDGAGVVEQVGAEVERFAPGDEVYFCNGGLGADPGNYAEYTVVDERFVARKPSSLSFAEAAGAPLVLITAWESLHDRTSIKPGQRVLIHAGAGGVGHLAIQLAKLAGAMVCTTVGSQAKADFVTSLGADKAILYRQRDFVEAVREWTGDAGVDLALDTVGAETFVKTFGAVGFYGDVVTILEPPREVDWKEARMRNLRIALELMLTPMLYGLTEARTHQAEILERGARLIDEGRLSLHVHQSLPLSEAATAHRLLESREVMGKLVLITED
jgi:NADPH2:quinone reductase